LGNAGLHHGKIYIFLSPSRIKINVKLVAGKPSGP